MTMSCTIICVVNQTSSVVIFYASQVHHTVIRIVLTKAQEYTCREYNEERVFCLFFFFYVHKKIKNKTKTESIYLILVFLLSNLFKLT